MIFYDSSSNIFYDDAFHGQRTVLMPDPAFAQDDPEEPVRYIEVANPACRIPPTAMPVDDHVWRDALIAQADGRNFTVGADGNPTWPPTPLHSYVHGEWILDSAKLADQQRAVMDANVSAGMNEARTQIEVLQDAVDLGIAADTEAEAYVAWRQYRVLLSRVRSDPAYPEVSLPQQPMKVIG